MTADLPRRFGPYVLIAPISVGPTSEIYLARSTGEARLSAAPVAIKIHRPPLTPRALERLRRRAFAQSPNLPRLFEMGEVPAHSFVVMEHVSGWTLAQVLEARGTEAMPLVSAARIVAGLAHALGKISTLGEPGDRVHGHLSPATILLGMEGRARIIGLDRDPPPGGVLGHAPPEQMMQAPLDLRADVYALGTIAWHLFTGVPWIPAGPTEMRRRMALDPEPRSLCEIVEDAPARLDALIATALDPDPAGRFESVDDLRDGILAAVPDARSPEPDVSELVGETLWTQRDATRTTLARLGESMMAFHDAREEFEGWGMPEPAAPTQVSGGPPAPQIPKLRSVTTPMTWADARARAAARLAQATPQAVRVMQEPTAELRAPAVTAPLPEEEEIVPPTVISKGSDPSRVRATPPPRIEPAHVEPTRTELRPGSEPSGPRVQSSPRPRRRSWGSFALSAVAVGVMGVVGWTIGRRQAVERAAVEPVTTPPPTVAPPAPIAARASTAAISAIAAVETATPAVEPSPVASPLVSDRPRPTARPTPRPSPTASAPPSPTIARPPGEAQMAHISKLIARARALKAGASADDAQELDRIVGALVLEAAAPDAPGIDGRIAALAERLARVER